MSPSAHLPHRMEVDASKCHTPATQTAPASAATNGNQARHQSQPSAISATPATQNAGRCRQAPRLPHRMKVYIAKRHACHANSRGVHGDKREPSAPREPAQRHKCHACHAELHVHVAECQACDAKDTGCHQVPRLPHCVCVTELCV